MATKKNKVDVVNDVTIGSEILDEYWHATARAPRPFPGAKAYIFGLDVLGAGARGAQQGAPATSSPATAPATRTVNSKSAAQSAREVPVSVPSPSTRNVPSRMNVPQAPQTKGARAKSGVDLVDVRKTMRDVGRLSSAAKMLPPGSIAARHAAAVVDAAASAAAKKIADAAKNAASSDRSNRDHSKVPSKAQVQAAQAKLVAAGKRAIEVGKKLSKTMPKVAARWSKFGQKVVSAANAGDKKLKKAQAAGAAAAKTSTKVRGNIFGAKDPQGGEVPLPSHLTHGGTGVVDVQVNDAVKLIPVTIDAVNNMFDAVSNITEQSMTALASAGRQSEADAGQGIVNRAQDMVASFPLTDKGEIDLEEAFWDFKTLTDPDPNQAGFIDYQGYTDTANQITTDANAWLQSVAPGGAAGGSLVPGMTTLTSAIGPTNSTIPVGSTDGFAQTGTADIVNADNSVETVEYSSLSPTALVGAQRGMYGTAKAQHAAGAQVVASMSSQAGAGAFDPGTAGSGGGGGGGSDSGGSDPFADDSGGGGGGSSGGGDPFADDGGGSAGGGGDPFADDGSSDGGSAGGGDDPFADTAPGGYDDSYAADYADAGNDEQYADQHQSAFYDQMMPGDNGATTDEEITPQYGSQAADEAKAELESDVLGMDFKWQYLFMPHMAIQDAIAERDAKKTSSIPQAEFTTDIPGRGPQAGPVAPNANVSAKLAHEQAKMAATMKQAAAWRAAHPKDQDKNQDKNQGKVEEHVLGAYACGLDVLGARR